MGRSKNAVFFVCCLICFSIFLGCGQASGQEGPDAEPSEPSAGKPVAEKPAAEEELSEEMQHVETLRIILENMTDLRKQIRAREKQLGKAKLQEDRERIRKELDELGDSLTDVQKSFNKIAAGIDLSIFEEEPSSGTFKWEKEVSDLLRPIINEMKNITSRPRKIEKLRGEIAFYETKLPVVKKAVENIDETIRRIKDKNLGRQLKSLKKNWENEEQELASHLSAANLQLEQLLRQKKPALESAQEFLKLFFKSRGRNLFLSLMAFLTVFFVLRFFYQMLCKVSPIHKAEERPFYVRLFDVAYHLLTILGSISALLAVLYFSGDWVLLTIALIFVLGIMWALRENIPRFGEQIKLLLNLGAVKENERLIYLGVPWKVTSLNLYTALENPALNIRISVPLQKLTELESYPYHKEIPWFPCKEGDWVLLSDGTRGQVVKQSHEIVVLGLRGGTRKSYLTPNFLGMNPTNLSTDFRLKVTFGVDYKHQAQSTQEIPEKLADALKEKIGKESFGEHLLNLRVDFKAAAASSLDFEIIADFSGETADLYGRISRALQRMAVEACNQYGWEIPFAQLVIHKAEG